MNISGLSTASNAYRPTASRSSAGVAVAENGRRNAGEIQRGTNNGSGNEEGNAKAAPAQGGELSAEEAAQVAKLKQIDRQVRQHEQAHLAAAGGMAVSGATFTYQKGPDGVNYAVGGEVGISTSPGRTPEETLSRAQTIRAAALAPADPSGQDRAVAAQAAQMALQAQMELAQQARQSPEDKSANDDTAAARQSRVAGFYAASSDRSGQSVSTYA